MLNIALGLASLVPDILKLFGRDDDSSVATKVIDVAKKITGKDNEGELLEALKSDPSKILEYKKALLEDKFVRDRIDLANVQSAREMHKDNHVQADKIADGVIRWNLWFVFGLVGLNIFVISVFKTNPELLALVSNVLGFVINSLLKERQDIINFYFGSSLGSKIKSFIGK